jgi:hypothetical protein
MVMTYSPGGSSPKVAMPGPWPVVTSVVDDALTLPSVEASVTVTLGEPR